MEKDRLSGKLAVILHADVAGSTALVQQDKQLAHERILDTFQRFSTTIEKYQGHVVELRGDALLAEFEHAADAVSAALSFQIDNACYLSKINDDLRPAVRVGIAMGEVVIADNTVTGAGVVQAQRVEQLSVSGGVCITAAIQEVLPKRMPFDLENLGEKSLKGFDYPVRVFRVELSSGESIPPPQEGSQFEASPKTPKLVVGIIVIALVIVGGTAYWLKTQVPREEPVSVKSMAYPLPDKPSIVVLPFTNMSGDPNQEYFADGMTEDLITDLSKISAIFVIARNSSFSFKGQQIKVQQVAEELGVRYILEGSVRRAANQVRINAQLVDATTGGQLWAERYDGSLADIFKLQDQVTTKIVSAMSVTLTPGELEDLGSIGTSNPSAHDAYLQGLSFYFRDTPVDNAKAEPHFLRALEFDPDFKRANAALAALYLKSREPEFSGALGIFWRKAIFLAHKNLEKTLGANIAQAHIVRSWMALNKHQVGVALREAERALTLSSNDVEALNAKALALIYSGQYEEGRKLANKAIRLDPSMSAGAQYIVGLSHFASRNYDIAIEHTNRAIELDPATNSYHRLLVSTYGKLGKKNEAEEAMRRFRKLWRGNFWIAAAVYRYPFQDGGILKDLADGFEAAGTAIRPPSRYLKFDRETKLSGQEIKTLLFGHSIKGRSYVNGNAWNQKRTINGKVLHSGISIHSGRRDVEEQGEGWIEDDRLCDRWSHADGDITICVLIFRNTDGDENDFYMLSDTGPHPFRVSN